MIEANDFLKIFASPTIQVDALVNLLIKISQKQCELKHFWKPITVIISFYFWKPITLIISFYPDAIVYRMWKPKVLFYPAHFP